MHQTRHHHSHQRPLHQGVAEYRRIRQHQPESGKDRARPQAHQQETGEYSECPEPRLEQGAGSQCLKIRLVFNKLPGPVAANPSGVAFNPNVPSLETMTRGALAYLSQDPNGFFVMIEGGAVDWAAHANNTARIIEEQVDFNRSVAAVVEWVEQNSSWDETLVIVLLSLIHI